MRVLLDECVDARLAPYIVGFQTRTVHDQGWGGITNGKLLAYVPHVIEAIPRAGKGVVTTVSL